MGSAARTASEFQQIIAHLDWDKDTYIAWFEEILKPEIQEKLIWQERPETLSELIVWAVKINNTLYNLNTCKKERQNGNNYWGKPWNNHYQANNKQTFQQHNQPRYDNPYGLQPMELDTTQQQWKGLLSTQEKEQQQNEKLCFACGKSGHMSRDCRTKQQNRSQQ